MSFNNSHLGGLMFRFPRSRVFEERISRARGEAPATGTLTPRSKLALTAGFIVAAVGAVMIGPQITSVWANDDDHASFWRAEAARKSAARQANIPPQPRPVAAAQARREQLPPRASAYAPVQRQQMPVQMQPHMQQSAVPQAPFWFFNQPGGPAASMQQGVQEPAPQRAKVAKAQRSVDAPRQASSRHVCVRLCDGFFFPTPLGVAANDAGCASACPGAPTRLYSMRSDRITDAVSVRDGSSYARLPVALHYTRVREQTCSCGATDPRTAIMTDASLRRGDRFMTEDGFKIYQGGNRSKISSRDFAPVREAAGISRQERNLLLAMERVSLPRPSERLATAPAAGTVVSLGPPSSSSRVAFR